MFTLQVWGLLYPTAIPIALVNVKKWNAEKHPIVHALMVVIVSTLIAMTFFYVSITFAVDLDIWIPIGMDRIVLPVGVFIAVWAVLLAGAPNQIHPTSSASPEKY